jgi:hypothetical protein
VHEQRVKPELAVTPAEDLWRKTLSLIPTVYGRLVYLASLRNMDTGRYEHHGLGLVFGAEAADGALRRSHEVAFREWLGFLLEQQKADIDLYMADLPTDRRTLVDNWLRLAPYRNLLPGSAVEPERRLYLADLETLLRLMQSELEAADGLPDA